MTLRLSSLLLGLALGLPTATAADATKAELGPWDDVWTMDLKDEERTYVDLDGASYLMIRDEELSDQLFVKDKDVVINAKFAAMDRERASFYRIEQLVVQGGDEHWARALDGDNLYLLGHIDFNEAGNPVIEIDHVVPAPSDAEIISVKLAAIPPDHYQQRLDLALWARKESETQGNRAWWLQAASDIVATTVRDAAKAATQDQNLDLLLKAMDWAVEVGSNRDLAAELGSQDWVLGSSDPQAVKVAQKMQALGYVLHSGKDGQAWLTQGQALQREYDQRLAELHWRDAEGFYQLGRWADKHADVLPHARELAHQAYTKGQQADPRHPGVRRELGLPAVAAETARASYALDFSHDSGVTINAPQGWDRTAKPVAAGADVTWIDPRSDTAFLAASVIDDANRPDIDVIWRLQLESLQLRPGFQPGAVQTGSHSEGRLRRMSYHIRSGDEVRPAELVVIYDPDQGYGVALTLSYVAQEQETAQAALEAAEAQVTLPTRPLPPAADAPSTPTTPQAPAPAPAPDGA